VPLFLIQSLNIFQDTEAEEFLRETCAVPVPQFSACRSKELVLLKTFLHLAHLCFQGPAATASTAAVPAPAPATDISLVALVAGCTSRETASRIDARLSTARVRSSLAKEYLQRSGIVGAAAREWSVTQLPNSTNRLLLRVIVDKCASNCGEGTIGQRHGWD
jgi:hypothetical protein